MSLRRSARNVKAVLPETGEAFYEKSGTNGLTKKLSDTPHKDVVPAPTPALQKKPRASKRTIDVPKAVQRDEVASKKIAAPKKPAASRKRKAPQPGNEPASFLSTVANVSIPGIPDSTAAAPDVVPLISSEEVASIDVSKVVQITTLPNNTISPPNDPAIRDLPAPEVSVNGVRSLPTTPVPNKHQRRKKANAESPLKPVPFTPTPSGVGLIAGSANVAKLKKLEDHMLDDLASLNANRLAAPDVTNAPVLTPNGSQVVVNDSPSKRRKANDLPPDVGSPMKASSTIDTLLKDAEAYLIRVDREVTGNGRLERLVGGHQCKMFNPDGLREVVDPFTALASGIIGQQVSGAAAASIRKKFTALFEDSHPAFPTPAQVLTKDLPTLRTAGLSQRKAEYITGLAEKFASGEFTAEGLVSASDEELIEKLVAVRGLGRWSVEMFACFGLKRMDVFSTGDLGVQRGMAAYMGRDVSKLKNKGGKWKYMSEQDMLSIASKFSPYRSLFMWYMWRIADVDTEVLE